MQDVSDTSLTAWGKVFLVLTVLLGVLAILGTITGVDDGGSARDIADCEGRQRQIQDAMNEARPNLPGSFEPEWDCEP